MVPDSSPQCRQEAVQDILHQLQTQALVDGSHRKYTATWRQWASWCAAAGRSPWLSGVRFKDSDQLISFAIWCWRPGPGHRRNAASTIMSKLGHISWYHRRYLGFPVGLHAGHQLAMQGMQRLSKPPSPKLPFTPGLLRRLRSRCNFRSAHDRVLWGAAVMGYFYMLRRSEYLSESGIAKPYAIQLRDITFRTRDGDHAMLKAIAHSVTIHFRGSKTDQEGRGTRRTLERSGSTWLCPVLAVWELVQHAHRLQLRDRDLLCMASKTKPISSTAMTTAIRRAALDAGEDPDSYGTHSMRSGGATSLFAAGVDRLAIKHLGRWRSGCYEQYARIDNVTLKGITAAMVTATNQPSSKSSAASPQGGHSTPHPRLELHNCK